MASPPPTYRFDPPTPDEVESLATALWTPVEVEAAEHVNRFLREAASFPRSISLVAFVERGCRGRRVDEIVNRLIERGWDARRDGSLVVVRPKGGVDAA